MSELPSFCRAKTLVLCCGNRFFGDDGFGPAVAELLQTKYRVPEEIYVMDVGTGVRKILFTLMLDGSIVSGPGIPAPLAAKTVVLVDAVDKGKRPGELMELTIDEVPPEKTDDFSMHQVPSSNLVKTLIERGFNVRILACQVARIPDSIDPGLSPAVASAVPSVSEQIAREYFGEAPV